MLSLAPAAGEPQPAADWLHTIKFDDVAIVVAGKNTLFPMPKLELGELPAFPLLPLPGAPPGGVPPSGSLEGPSWAPLRPPSTDWQDSSGQGGMIDIGDFDNTAPDIFSDLTSKQEARAVVEMLASLDYRPDDGDTDSAFQTGDFLAEAEYETAPAESSAISGQQFHDTQSDGGMIAIAVDEVVAQIVADEIPHIGQIESLLDVSVQMDNAYGKFQVFEVSAVEEKSVFEISPDAHDAGVSSAQDRPTGEVDSADRDPAAGDHLPNKSADGRPQESEESATEEVPPHAAEGLPPSTASPVVGDNRSSLSWTRAAVLLTAAAGVYAYRARATRGACVRFANLALLLAPTKASNV